MAQRYPINLRVQTLSDISVTLKWDVSASGTMPDAFMISGTNGFPSNMNISPYTFTYTASISPNTIYDVQVVSRTGGTISPASYTYFTAPAGTYNQPTSLSASYASSNITVTWVKPSVGANTFLYYRIELDGETIIVESLNTQSEDIFVGPCSPAAYVVRIYAVYTTGTSEYSEFIHSSASSVPTPLVDPFSQTDVLCKMREMSSFSLTYDDPTLTELIAATNEFHMPVAFQPPITKLSDYAGYPVDRDGITIRSNIINIYGQVEMVIVFTYTSSVRFRLKSKLNTSGIFLNTSGWSSIEYEPTHKFGEPIQEETVFVAFTASAVASGSIKSGQIEFEKYIPAGDAWTVTNFTGRETGTSYPYLNVDKYGTKLTPDFKYNAPVSPIYIEASDRTTWASTDVIMDSTVTRPDLTDGMFFIPFGHCCIDDYVNSDVTSIPGISYTINLLDMKADVAQYRLVMDVANYLGGEVGYGSGIGLFYSPENSSVGIKQVKEGGPMTDEWLDTATSNESLYLYTGTSPIIGTFQYLWIESMYYSNYHSKYLPDSDIRHGFEINPAGWSNKYWRSATTSSRGRYVRCDVKTASPIITAQGKYFYPVIHQPIVTPKVHHDAATRQELNNMYISSPDSGIWRIRFSTGNIQVTTGNTIYSSMHMDIESY